MAKKVSPKLTKASLINQIDARLSDLNLLRSALHADRSANSQKVLLEYKQRFHDMLKVS